jgi:hypothetical protein
MTFIYIHLISICVVLLWHIYETYPVLSLKSRCDTECKLCDLFFGHSP